MQHQTRTLEVLGGRLARVQERYAAFNRKKLVLARDGGELLRWMKAEVRKGLGQNWLDWLGTPEARRFIRVSVRTCQNWMQVSRQWPAIEAMLADNPRLIDLGLVDVLKLLRHRKHCPARVKGLTPDEAQEL